MPTLSPTDLLTKLRETQGALDREAADRAAGDYDRLVKTIAAGADPTKIRPAPLDVLRAVGKTPEDLAEDVRRIQRSAELRRLKAESSPRAAAVKLFGRRLKAARTFVAACREFARDYRAASAELHALGERYTARQRQAAELAEMDAGFTGAEAQAVSAEAEAFRHFTAGQLFYLRRLMPAVRGTVYSAVVDDFEATDPSEIYVENRRVAESQIAENEAPLLAMGEDHIAYAARLSAEALAARVAGLAEELRIRIRAAERQIADRKKWEMKRDDNRMRNAVDFDYAEMMLRHTPPVARLEAWLQEVSADLAEFESQRPTMTAEGAEHWERVSRFGNTPPWITIDHAAIVGGVSSRHVS